MLDLLRRVEQYLHRKKREEELVKNLSEKLEEKMEDTFPTAELEQLIESVKTKKQDITDDINRLCNAIEALFGGDPIKTGTAFKKAMSELVSQLKLHYAWIVNFIDTNKYKSIDFIADDRPLAAQETFGNAAGELYEVIRSFEYGSTEEQLENRICRHVLENIDTNLSIEGISRVLFMNRKYISEVFRQKTGELLIEYITRVKMARAARLLCQSTRKTYGIALQLGYRDTEYFSRLFKKHMGVTPSEYRNSAAEL
jgi:two-component system response regulator YesN